MAVKAVMQASKAGVIGFTKSIAEELGSRNIRCNAIAPGFVETDMTSYLKDGDGAEKYKAGIPLGRFGTTTISPMSLFPRKDNASSLYYRTGDQCLCGV
jgi:3-oxoacyl-[acyl-carrier protein] reductase